jgi:hypothetical protein
LNRLSSSLLYSEALIAAVEPASENIPLHGLVFLNYLVINMNLATNLLAVDW